MGRILGTEGRITTTFSYTRDAEAAGPEDESEVGPDGGVLVREHDDLHAIVRHVRSEVGIGSTFTLSIPKEPFPVLLEAVA